MLEVETLPVLKNIVRFPWLSRLVCALIAVVAVVGAAYCYWMTTPSYAVASIIASLQNHDVDAFEKYFDIDAVSGSAFEDLLSGPARSYVAGKLNGPMVFMGMDFLRFFKQDVVAIAHQQVVQAVRDKNAHLNTIFGAPSQMATVGLVGLALPFCGSRGLLLPKNNAVVEACPEADTSMRLGSMFSIKEQLRQWGLSAKGFRGIKFLETHGSEARLGLEFYSAKMNQSWIAEFKMEDCGGYWRVTELSNLNALASKYIAVRESQQL